MSKVTKAIANELRTFLGEDHHEWPILEAAFTRIARLAATEAYFDAVAMASARKTRALFVPSVSSIST